MPFWVVTANGTVSGPFAESHAWKERSRLIALSNGQGAEDITVVPAANKDEARKYKPPII